MKIKVDKRCTSQEKYNNSENIANLQEETSLKAYIFSTTEQIADKNNGKSLVISISDPLLNTLRYLSLNGECINSPNTIVTVPNTVLPTVTSQPTPSNNKRYFSTAETAAATTTPAVSTTQLTAVTATSQAPETRQEHVEGKLEILRNIERVLTVLRIFVG